MKINFRTTLKDMDGKPIMETKDKPLLLDKVCVEALLSETPNEQTTGESKLNRFNLAKRIHGSGEIDVSTEEIVLIKDRVGKHYFPIVVGQVFVLLEGK